MPSGCLVQLLASELKLLSGRGQVILADGILHFPDLSFDGMLSRTVVQLPFLVLAQTFLR